MTWRIRRIRAVTWHIMGRCNCKDDLALSGIFVNLRRHRVFLSMNSRCYRTPLSCHGGSIKLQIPGSMKTTIASADNDSGSESRMYSLLPWDPVGSFAGHNARQHGGNWSWAVQWVPRAPDMSSKTVNLIKSSHGRWISGINIGQTGYDKVPKTNLIAGNRLAPAQCIILQYMISYFYQT